MSSYKIVYSDYLLSYDIDTMKNLQEKVEVLLNEGWTCTGGVTVSFNKDGHVIRIYQAMIKM
jgi:hypothetical protein